MLDFRLPRRIPWPKLQPVGLRQSRATPFQFTKTQRKIDQNDRVSHRNSLVLDGVSPKQLSQRLAEENIFVWHGHYYAVEVIDFLGLKEKGGMLRVGAAHYNTTQEIDQLLEEIARIKAKGWKIKGKIVRIKAAKWTKYQRVQNEFCTLIRYQRLYRK